MEKLIVTVAPTGSVPARKDNPSLPLTPEEIGRDVYECFRAGASVVHIHARKNGMPTSDVSAFSEIVSEIKERCDVIIQISTGGRGREGEERASGLALKPEMASLTCGSVNFPTIAYVNEPSLIEFLSERMRNLGIKPEIEVFDTSMIQNAITLQEKGLIAPPLHFNFVLGLRGALPATPKNLLHLVESIPLGSTWTVSGIERHQLPMNVLSIIMGGHVRVGLEDNIYYAKDTLATNVMLVQRIVRVAREVGREVATPQEARRILNLR